MYTFACVHKLCSGFQCSAGLTIWQKRHMPRAPRFWGPRAALILFYVFRNFCSLFHRGAQTVRQCGAPKSLSPPENARPQRAGPQTVFSFPVTVRAPKSPTVPQKTRAQKFKKRGPHSPQTGFFLFQCFSAGPQRAHGPQITSVLKI
jgi:hypothetical protein